MARKGKDTITPHGNFAIRIFGALAQYGRALTLGAVIAALNGVTTRALRLAMNFHPDARQILKRATLLALSQGHAEVDVVHFLEARWDWAPDLVEVRDIPFSGQALQMLEGAAELAGREHSDWIRADHILSVLIRTGGRRPESAPHVSP